MIFLITVWGSFTKMPQREGGGKRERGRGEPEGRPRLSPSESLSSGSSDGSSNKNRSLGNLWSSCLGLSLPWGASHTHRPLFGGGVPAPIRLFSSPGIRQLLFVCGY